MVINGLLTACVISLMISWLRSVTTGAVCKGSGGRYYAVSSPVRKGADSLSSECYVAPKRAIAFRIAVLSVHQFFQELPWISISGIIIERKKKPTRIHLTAAGPLLLGSLITCTNVSLVKP